MVLAEPEGDALRLTLSPDADSQHILEVAMRAGRVTQFGFERIRLSEVFREAIG